MLSLNNKRSAFIFGFLLLLATASIAVLKVNINSNSKAVTKTAYIIQGMAIESMANLVDKAGGEISHKLPIINAIGATLTEGQFEFLSSNSDLRLLENREVISHSNQSTLPDYATETHIVKQIEADHLHNRGIKGQGITIASIDSGISAKNERGSYLRLDSNGGHRLIAKYDAIKGKQVNSLNDDYNGHGSHVAGIAVSSVKDHTGRYNGVAPNAMLVSIKAFDKDGKGSYLDVIKGLDWMVSNKRRYNIRVANLSFGSAVQSHYWEDPLNMAVMKAWDAGIVVVTSAGNRGPVPMTITAPGNVPYVITVGAATDSFTPDNFSDDRMTTFSSQGPTFESFVKPEIVSWGGHNIGKINGDLVKDLEKKHRKNNKGHDYYQVAGTSQAAAVISGTVALMLNLEPWLSPDTVKCRLMATANAVGNGSGYSPFKQGAGLANAYDAVMSYADRCANKGLDIRADIRGDKHFRGPALVNENGEFGITDGNGNVASEGTGWEIEGTGWEIEGTGWEIEGTGWEIEGTGWEIEGTGWNTIEGTGWELEGTGWDVEKTESAIESAVQDNQG